ncbi:MAG: CooT family nickel-binding protein [Methanomassiliicoccales archaeon]|nr:MAG: CooT family nickel-binding protein [Methanomassiliicoccales archaeon]
MNDWDNMCESTVFLEKDGESVEFMKDVAKILIEGDRLTIIGILGEEKTINGRIATADLMNHKITVVEE